MKKSTFLTSRAYETPEVEEILVEIPTVLEGSCDNYVCGGDMDDPTPEVPD